MLILEAMPSLNIIFWRVVRSAEINFPYFMVFYVSFAPFHLPCYINCIYILHYNIKDGLEQDRFGFEGSFWEFA